jgi:hypothetical protein
MPKLDYLVLRFSGDKAGLKKQLKEWCAIKGKDMNPTVINLIQELLNARENK